MEFSGTNEEDDEALDFVKFFSLLTGEEVGSYNGKHGYIK